QTAVQHAPKNADLLNDMGYCYYGHGRWEEAEDTLRKALSINPKHERALNNLGMVLAQRGQYDESLETFCRVVPRAQAMSNVAFILTAQGKREEAKAAYRQALSIDPDLRLVQAALEKLENAKADSKSPEVASTSSKPQADNQPSPLQSR